jgi:MerR family mercuric resistance operon transcriptional regulator
VPALVVVEAWGRVRSNLTDLQRIERVLHTLIGQCDRSQGEVRCPLIAALHAPTAVPQR